MTLQMLVDRYIINEKIELGAGCQPAGVAIPKFMKSHLPKCGMLTPEGVSLVIGRGGAPPTFLGNALFPSTLNLTECNLTKCAKNPIACANCAPKPNPEAESKEVIDQILKPLSYAPTSVQIMPMPIDGTVFDLFWAAAGALLPWCFVLIFKYSEYLAISTFITEKETRVREGLKMMGVTNAALIISWYLTYAIILFVMTFCLTLALKLTLMRLTSFVLLNLFFWLFTMSYIAFGYLIHTFFDKAMTGGIVGMIMSFAMFVVKVAAITPDTPYGQQMWLSLLAPTAFAQGISLVATYEKNEKALDFSSMHDDVENFTFGSALLMLTVDIIIYTLLGAYLDEVLPKQFGIQQPLCFCFSKAYWKGNAVQDGVEEEDSAADDFGEDDEPDIEEVPMELQQQEQSNSSVNINKLRKVFSTPDGPKVAVHGLNLTIYRDQIFVLLGHNGAGKTTTMTMLTGLYMPSSGDATVQGRSIKTQMPEIRQRIGVCPQHDVLFAELTVIEHLQIFAGLKGLVGAEAETEVEEKIAEVGLTEKKAVRSSNLSGGQRRKLSLAISLIGNSTAVFLDEPTSGMDPYSRRSTWNILQSNREGRVIILTTHFMGTPSYKALTIFDRKNARKIR
jgi:ATP-binding cassette subfamily A (ABC1) protein 3